MAADTKNADQALKLLSYAALDKNGAVAASGGSDISANIDASAEVLSNIPQQNPNLKGVDTLMRY
ncbi:hypothetical protein, partial [Mesorhizobium sp.]|uniref:hypothetical protein n=1 Tax=Mesorhizobium sp. TaxID=1871066 RepID=UPI00257BD0E2